MIKSGDKVKLTEEYKKALRKGCTKENHINLMENWDSCFGYSGSIELGKALPEPFFPCLKGTTGCINSHLPDQENCLCSSEHANEFGDCIGIVEDLVFDDMDSLFNVRWQPSKLRYGYFINTIMKVETV